MVNQISDIPAYAQPADDAVASGSFLDRLPIEDIKRQGMENVATAISGTYEYLNAIKHSLDEKSLTIKIEKRKLILSF